MITTISLSFTYSHSYTLSHTGSTELNPSPPNEVKLEHFEMNTNDAYGTNSIEIATTGNVAYGQVPPGTDDCYDYVI